MTTVDFLSLKNTPGKQPANTHINPTLTKATANLQWLLVVIFHFRIYPLLPQSSFVSKEVMILYNILELSTMQI